MNHYDSSNAIRRIYGENAHIDKKMPGHYPEDDFYSTGKSSKKRTRLMPIAMEFIREKCNVSDVLRELVFSVICIFVFYSFLDGKSLASLKGFNQLVSWFLIAAIAYQFYKASLKSFIPGFVCIAIGVIVKSCGLHDTVFDMLTLQHINYIFGLGGIYISVCVLCDK